MCIIYFLFVFFIYFSLFFLFLIDFIFYFKVFIMFVFIIFFILFFLNSFYYFNSGFKMFIFYIFIVSIIFICIFYFLIKFIDNSYVYWFLWLFMLFKLMFVIMLLNIFWLGILINLILLLSIIFFILFIFNNCFYLLLLFGVGYCFFNYHSCVYLLLFFFVFDFIVLLFYIYFSSFICLTNFNNSKKDKKGVKKKIKVRNVTPLAWRDQVKVQNVVLVKVEDQRSDANKIDPGFVVKHPTLVTPHVDYFSLISKFKINYVYFPNQPSMYNKFIGRDDLVTLDHENELCLSGVTNKCLNYDYSLPFFINDNFLSKNIKLTVRRNNLFYSLNIISNFFYSLSEIFKVFVNNCNFDCFSIFFSDIISQSRASPCEELITDSDLLKCFISENLEGYLVYLINIRGLNYLLVRINDKSFVIIILNSNLCFSDLSVTNNINLISNFLISYRFSLNYSSVIVNYSGFNNFRRFYKKDSFWVRYARFGKSIAGKEYEFNNVKSLSLKLFKSFPGNYFFKKSISDYVILAVFKISYYKLISCTRISCAYSDFLNRNPQGIKNKAQYIAGYNRNYRLKANCFIDVNRVIKTVPLFLPYEPETKVYYNGIRDYMGTDSYRALYYEADNHLRLGFYRKKDKKEVNMSVPSKVPFPVYFVDGFENNGFKSGILHSTQNYLNFSRTLYVEKILHFDVVGSSLCHNANIFFNENNTDLISLSHTNMYKSNIDAINCFLKFIYKRYIEFKNTNTCLDFYIRDENESEILNIKKRVKNRFKLSYYKIDSNLTLHDYFKWYGPLHVFSNMVLDRLYSSNEISHFENNFCKECYLSYFGFYRFNGEFFNHYDYQRNQLYHRDWITLSAMRPPYYTGHPARRAYRGFYRFSLINFYCRKIFGGWRPVSMSYKFHCVNETTITGSISRSLVSPYKVGFCFLYSKDDPYIARFAKVKFESYILLNHNITHNVERKKKLSVFRRLKASNFVNITAERRFIINDCYDNIKYNNRFENKPLFKTHVQVEGDLRLPSDSFLEFKIGNVDLKDKPFYSNSTFDHLSDNDGDFDF